VAAAVRSTSQAQMYAGFSWGTVLVAALVSIATGLAFGSYPALRASRLSPIDAIRHD
jgi:putative ABC transport system permease protein